MRGLEERIARIEGQIDEMSKRLNHIESDIKELRIDQKSNFKWIIGLLITMWVTIIIAIMLK